MSKIPPAAEKDPRMISLRAVYEVLEKGAYANIILDRLLGKSSLSSDDRHLTTEIVNGTIRMVKHLDWVLNLFLRKPVADQNPWLRNVLRISLYQMMFMEKIPDYAVVNSAVQLATAKVGSRLAGVANGVLRNIARNREELKYPEDAESRQYMAVYYSQPEWLVELWLSQYPNDEVKAMLDYCNQRPELVLRNNCLRGTRDQLIYVLQQEGVACRKSPRTPWGLVVDRMEKNIDQLSAYQEGRFYVQNEASMLAVAILAPQPGEHLVDLCSGVGGKATFMAEQMGNQGLIEAYEIYPHKLKLLNENCNRLGTTIVKAYQQDVLNMPRRDGVAGVLLDAPCSGLGVLNRRTDARWKKSPGVLGDLTGLQYSMLEKAGRLVGPGGRLVYSTCTINKAENQDIVAEYLRRHPAFVLEGFGPELRFFPLDERDSNMAEAGMLTLLPGKYHTDGMFYAKMTRSGS